MKISDLTENDVGRVMLHTDLRGEESFGILSSWNAEFIFCKFSLGDTAAACLPRDIEFAYFSVEDEERSFLPMLNLYEPSTIGISWNRQIGRLAVHKGFIEWIPPALGTERWAITEKGKALVEQYRSK